MGLPYISILKKILAHDDATAQVQAGQKEIEIN